MYCIIIEMHNLSILFCAYRTIVLQSALLHFFHAIYVCPVLCRLFFVRPYWPPLLSISRTAPDWFTTQMVGRWQIAYLLRYAHIVLPEVDCLPAQLWLTLYCQRWIAYLLSYGSHCIANDGLLTCSAMDHIVLPVVGCLPAQLWHTWHCQWWVAYLLSYGSHCIARGGLLTCSGMAHIVLYCQWWLAYLLSCGSHCIVSGGLLTCSGMAHIVLSVVCFIPPQQLWLTLYCQWWVAYLHRYGSQVCHIGIAICGLLTWSAMVRK